MGGGYGQDQRAVAQRHANAMLAMADENAKFPPPPEQRAARQK